MLGVTTPKPYHLTNSNGEPLLVHTFIIYDEDESTPENIYVVYEYDSTFVERWKERDLEECLRKAQLIIKAIKEDPSMLERGEISYKLEPKPVVIGDQYENDCKVYAV